MMKLSPHQLLLLEEIVNHEKALGEAERNSIADGAKLDGAYSFPIGLLHVKFPVALALHFIAVVHVENEQFSVYAGAY